MNIRAFAWPILLTAGWWGGLFAGDASAAPVGSAFSYQGRLLESGAPANGGFDLEFQLFTTEVGGSPCAGPLTNAAVLVSNGVFTTTLDFGQNVFSGTNCWLEIAVRGAGRPGDFVVLIPRQLLTPAPYAIYTLKAESLIGPVPDAQLSTNVARLDTDQTFRGAVTFQGGVAIGASGAAASLNVQGKVLAAAFSGNGAGLSNVTASAFSASQMQRLWRGCFHTSGGDGW